MIDLFPLMPGFTVRIGEPLVLPESIGARVDAIWSEEKKKSGERLYNGKVYSLADRGDDFLLIRSAEYRHVLARRRAPELEQGGLIVRPLGVTGILICPDGLVLGKRSGLVAVDAGMWEPAPAGGLSMPDPAAQILDELKEELGIDPFRVVSSEVCGIVEDRASGVCDIVYRMRIDASGDDIRNSHQEFGTDEYAEVAIVKSEHLSAFLDRDPSRLLPALKPMLTLAGLL